jgi:hypothetical protein
LVTQIESQIVHSTEEMALCAVHLRQQRRKLLVVVYPVRPCVTLPDIAFIFAFHAVIVVNFHRPVNTITAFFAVY